LIKGRWHYAAAKLLLRSFAFERLGCNRVRLKTEARNVYSPAAIARLGAVREEGLRAHMVTRAHTVMPDGGVRDTVMLASMAAEWPAVRARLGNFYGDEPSAKRTHRAGMFVIH
jgi:aminoglycoside 6'-N-acetyltransferase